MRVRSDILIDNQQLSAKFVGFRMLAYENHGSEIVNEKMHKLQNYSQ